MLADASMPGAKWFTGAELSYPEHIFRDRPGDRVAIRHASELRDLGEWTWDELREQTARIAAGLKAMGIERGDRVVAYMPNIPETIAAFLATASLGAVWSSCSPDFGARCVVDRFAQIEPKVLLTVDGYRYGGKDHDRSELIERVQGEMPSLERTVTLGYLDGDGGDWDEAFPPTDEELTFERVPFDHPLWVLYSSGTTGLPKAIVHSQGGILLEHLKKHHLHLDAQEGDRVFWFTTTGWMMWNFLVGVLLTDASIVLYDGNPGTPDMGVLWDLAEQTGMTCFGTSAAYIAACMKAGVEPGEGRDLSALRSVGSTGSPLAPEGFEWIYEQARQGHLAVLHQRRHRHVHRVRGRRAAAAGLPRRAPGPRAGREGRGLRRGRQRRDRRGRRARDHRADAVDADLLLGRRGRREAARVLLRDVSRASGATATGSASPSAAPR